MAVHEEYRLGRTGSTALDLMIDVALCKPNGAVADAKSDDVMIGYGAVAGAESDDAMMGPLDINDEHKAEVRRVRTVVGIVLSFEE